ncbi:hypothetical protein CYLTODRAFT_492273 [Cylindrobasidium torrendii FP15055 ss-10]|uniref:Terpenoid synthase n=1 Tax=Cylindrobasidium torrendii FP15055 ss-10 TaxID=1314674 RepID=A0A0D7B4I8_9AGAR|nr:hypothetical protein CYLTODRAFT_492273 [Cylindrobasidium torrendii FP15055 ss-10]
MSATSNGHLTIQLPDLPSLVRKFELGISQHCSTLVQTPDSEYLPPSLQGRFPYLASPLLVSACFSRCNLSQLRLLSKFCALWILSLPISPVCQDARSSLQHFLRQDIVDRLYTPITRHDDDQADLWQKRFKSAVFNCSVPQPLDNAQHPVDLQTYIESCREANGVRLLLEFLEPCGGYSLMPESPAIQALRETTVDIISWSLDIASYMHRPETSSNLIPILMLERGISAQTAAYAAGDMVKEAVEKFFQLEEDLFDSLTPRPPPFFWCRMLWAKTDEHDKRIAQDIRLWVQGLRGCIAGAVNWIYETDLFFGTSAANVREYGWVFVNPDQVDA